MTVVTFPGVTFPDRLRASLRYYDTVNLAGGVPSPNAQVFLMNSLYDPDSTGTGHQPEGYDQLTAIYLKYLVVEFEYHLQIYNLATAPTKWAICMSETDISSRTVDQLAEQKYVDSGFIGRADGGDCLIQRSGRMKLSKLMGQRILDSDTSMYANYNASPSDGAFFIIKVASLDGSSNANCYVHCEFIYHASFKDRNDPTAS